jgi:dihydroneopterin aldolase
MTSSNRPDTLHLHGLEVDCRLGVHDWEQRAAQPVWIDLELPIDAARAAARDDVSQAVDYAALVDRLRTLASRRPFRLMETLAESAADLVLSETGAAWVQLRVRKRAVKGLGDAAVQVTRTRVRRPALRAGRAQTKTRSPRAART